MRIRRHLALASVATAGILGLTACGGNALANSCEDYWEFDQDHAGAIGEAMQLVGSGESYDADAVRAMIDDATNDFNALIDSSQDDTFVEEASKTLPMFDMVNTLADPDVSIEEKTELMGSSGLNEVMEAERNLIEICEAEIN
ncbi:hypothetical protein [Enteractinococcus helveticum]|uniref:Lipoprotein n=1 Tax=Enteractinococcus helveticum TaxID=1837282 RepID=A0A1B7M0A2_9MICC|nr:hypothetical protein [Enteractinococcus helveticum]OAV61497.1 hypothetical protein A6F49_08610 [Enteractinococcus helveticum]